MLDNCGTVHSTFGSIIVLVLPWFFFDSYLLYPLGLCIYKAVTRDGQCVPQIINVCTSWPKEITNQSSKRTMTILCFRVLPIYYLTIYTAEGHLNDKLLFITHNKFHWFKANCNVYITTGLNFRYADASDQMTRHCKHCLVIPPNQHILSCVLE